LPAPPVTTSVRAFRVAGENELSSITYLTYC
jgi:hypothetical protein